MVYDNWNDFKSYKACTSFLPSQAPNGCYDTKSVLALILSASLEGSGFKQKCPEPEPNRTFPSLRHLFCGMRLFDSGPSHRLLMDERDGGAKRDDGEPMRRLGGRIDAARTESQEHVIGCRIGLGDVTGVTKRLSGTLIGRIRAGDFWSFGLAFCRSWGFLVHHTSAFLSSSFKLVLLLRKISSIFYSTLRLILDAGHSFGDKAPFSSWTNPTSLILSLFRWVLGSRLAIFRDASRPALGMVFNLGRTLNETFKRPPVTIPTLPTILNEAAALATLVGILETAPSCLTELDLQIPLNTIHHSNTRQDTDPGWVCN
ncbi:hypothetical protein DFH06DRAFT_1419000 [Mycena polygramma]|nr:hypothetical protein DFH06DRAFT_1419000 [Mycena polygramma]